MISKIAKIAVTAVIFLSLTCLLSAQEAKTEKKFEVRLKEVSGKITSLSPNFLAVETGIDQKEGAALESAFNLGKDVRIVHKKNLKELNIGDTVSVGYEETVETMEDGRKMRKSSVKTITFLNPAPVEIRAPGQPTPSEEEEPDAGSFSLKGLKEDGDHE